MLLLCVLCRGNRIFPRKGGRPKPKSCLVSKEEKKCFKCNTKELTMYIGM